jgi:hypothetical protein
MIFEITWSSTSYENRIVSYGSVLSEVYFSLRNAGALSTSGSDIVFAIKNGYLPGYGRPIHYRLIDNSSRGILTIFRDIGNDIEDQIQFDYVNSAIYKMSIARYGSDVVYKHRPADEVGKVLMVGDNRQVIAADLPVQTQSDWTQTDESAPDFIKNKPDEEDALALLVEVGFVEPAVAADGSIYTDENGNIYTL